MDFLIPSHVRNTLNILEKAGYEAFIVGGSVRDLMLNKIPSDYDITTSATPIEIEKAFDGFKTINIGKEYGTIVVVQPEGNLEITTYRSEGIYLDGRRPSEITFSKNINEDLSRRDFTINSMAYNEKTGIIDPFNGVEDIENKIIRTVGNPKERLNEDYLRIMRAVRFSAQLGFSIEEDTYNVCKELSKFLQHISAERIRDEFTKILISDIPSKSIRIMLNLNILHVILPELLSTVDYDQRNPNHEKQLFDHILCVVDNTPPSPSVRMAALLHDIAKPLTFSLDENGIGHYYNHDKLGAEISKEILARLRFSNVFIDKVYKLIREHMHFKNMKEKGLKRQIRRVGEENIFDLIELKKADKVCKSDNKDISLIEEREERIRAILNNKEPFEKSHLNIDGNDIIALGYKPGKEIGKILDYLLERVLEHPEYNKKEKLIRMIKERGK